ncbi:MAG: succinate dehydrogenase assembly factor 2 [Parvibaculales bacterium]
MQDFHTKLDDRRKKLYFRSCHRGIKEMDIIFSKFAEAVLADLPDSQLEDYERILELSDTDLFAWATGRQDLPDGLSSPLLDQLLSLAHMTR